VAHSSWNTSAPHDSTDAPKVGPGPHLQLIGGGPVQLHHSVGADAPAQKTLPCPDSG
jgi:hypothetical protein